MLLDSTSCTTQLASQVLDAVLTHIHPYRWHVLDVGVICGAVWILLRWLRPSCRQLRTTQLRGPPSESIMYGVEKNVLDNNDLGAMYEKWAQEYGPVYTIPSVLGRKKIILSDPKAIAHFCSKDMRTYIQTTFSKKGIEIFFGKGIMWAHGEDHKRQRRSLAPAFSVAAIRQLTPIFHDSAYKVKGAWNALIESSGGDSALIDMESWMNRITLDNLGLAVFSHDFGAVEGKRSNVTEHFDTFNASPSSSSFRSSFLLWAQTFPSLLDMPTPPAILIKKLSNALTEIFNEMLTRTRKELEMGASGGKEDRSIIGLLVKGASTDSHFHLTEEEVIAQMKFLLLAGHETISVSFSWALIELSRNPDVQTRLRNELLEHGTDPTYDQLSHGLPYLDAVVHETFRLHPPVNEITRIAIDNDIIPLSGPILTKSGELVDSLTVTKGTQITIPIESINRSAALWGQDAKAFRPSRWLEDAHGQSGIPTTAKEIRGHRHLLTFSDGVKMCQGKNLVVTTLKMVLAVLVKNFTFELPDGSEIEIGMGIVSRPAIAGEVGCKLPMRLRPYAA